MDPAKNWERREGLTRPATLLAFARHYSGRGVAGIGVYSSNDYTWYPEHRRALLAAGHAYDPVRRAEKARK